jgi:hypothetical protein
MPLSAVGRAGHVKACAKLASSSKHCYHNGNLLMRVLVMRPLNMNARLLVCSAAVAYVQMQQC